MMTSARTLRIDLSYKGTEFRGFAENPGVRTVGGELRQALETVLGEEIELTVAGRTDAGVHALGQVGHFDLEVDHSADTVRDALNFHLKTVPVAILEAEKVDEDFHSRFSATGGSGWATPANSPNSATRRAPVPP